MRGWGAEGGEKRMTAGQIGFALPGGRRNQRRRRRRLLPSRLFAGMFVGGRAVLVSLLAVLVSHFGVFLRLLVLAKIVMMGGLMMMVGGGVVMSRGLVMMLAGWMLRLCHCAFPPNRS
jgi:hypothetical protein